MVIDSEIIASALSGTGDSICGGILSNEVSSIYVDTDYLGSLHSYVTTNYKKVTTITEGQYAGYTCYSIN